MIAVSWLRKNIQDRFPSEIVLLPCFSCTYIVIVGLDGNQNISGLHCGLVDYILSFLLKTRMHSGQKFSWAHGQVFSLVQLTPMCHQKYQNAKFQVICVFVQKRLCGGSCFVSCAKLLWSMCLASKKMNVWFHSSVGPKLCCFFPKGHMEHALQVCLSRQLVLVRGKTFHSIV